MARVYAIYNEWGSAEMERIHVQNEDLELQRILEKNYDLLPGDQINPEEPRQWLLIKREMPVPDPGTGQPRWNIDFLFADQDAIPTFVECKRFGDTRARREVVGQMIEYAAIRRDGLSANKDAESQPQSILEPRALEVDVIRSTSKIIALH